MAINLLCLPLQATIVRFDTVLGSFSVRMFDTATPLSTQNFLNYVNDGDFVDSFFHRSVPGFIVQSGGYTCVSGGACGASLQTDPPVMNEPSISNIRGTIAYAKLSGNPNSATSGWFGNLSHNTENLDNQNGGFTVFAAILGEGMEVFDAIAGLQIVNAGGAFNTLPVQNFSGNTIFREHLIIVNSVSVVEFLAGDYNFDGTVDLEDLGKWSKDYGRLQLIGGDYDDDKQITGFDFLKWQTGFGNAAGAAYTEGNSDGDLFVNSIDLLLWEQGFGSTTDVAADGNGDAHVSGADFLLWQQNFGASVTTLSAIQSIPEPGAVALALLAALPTWFRRRRG
ncbi:MAG: peptidylprolyl isomerase [Planctomycetales bacterium]|nr:peptidylprolyl isomerase [Planctomycetales bacterium]